MKPATIWRNLDFTRDWQARCPACHRAVDLADLGCRRDAPRMMTKRSFGWCRSCRSLRLFHLEPTPPHAAD